MVEAVDLVAGLSQPFRDRFGNRLLVCLEMGADERVHPPVPISRADFDACLADFHQWATANARAVELAGDLEGPFEDQHRARELELDPIQRVNYWHGFSGGLDEACDMPLEGTLVNPFEWSLATRAFVRFARRWPAYFAEADVAGELAELLTAGRELLDRGVVLD